MALPENCIRFLLEAKADGVSVRRTATLGRQSFLVSANALCKILHSFGYNVSTSECVDLVERDEGFIDSLFRFLGSETIQSYDASAYEGATDIHDFNMPISPEHHQRFDLVLDVGSLEHIFNAPTALRNCMEMVSIGGHVIAMSPGNNWFGHGFYQFSPEFFYRALSPENGFEIRRVSLFEDYRDPLWRDVLDPARTGRRAEAMSRRRTMLAVLAKRVVEAPVFAQPPQQSDYVQAWMTDADAGGAATLDRSRGFAERARGYVPESLRARYRWVRSLRNRRRYDSAIFPSRPVPRRKD